ncbi:MAG: hypothetical protein H0V12_04640 [Chloroflexi bacterium]|nr:hypothetical protein [Chloroflexota bacterium]
MTGPIPFRLRLVLVLLASGLMLVSSLGSQVHAACEPVYGPNGSQDPALGYSPVCTAAVDHAAARSIAYPGQTPTADRPYLTAF